MDVVAENNWTEYLSTAVASGTSPISFLPATRLSRSGPPKGLVADVDDEKFSKYLDLDDEELGFNKELMAQFSFQGHPQWAIVADPALLYDLQQDEV